MLSCHRCLWLPDYVDYFPGFGILNFFFLLSFVVHLFMSFCRLLVCPWVTSWLVDVCFPSHWPSQSMLLEFSSSVLYFPLVHQIISCFRSNQLFNARYWEKASPKAEWCNTQGVNVSPAGVSGRALADGECGTGRLVLAFGTPWALSVLRVINCLFFP